jgi:hypothetical protein
MTIVSASEAVDMEVALCCVMTERKCGVDEEMEVGGRTGGGQNQSAPLWELAANIRTPAATALPLESILESTRLNIHLVIV